MKLGKPRTSKGLAVFCARIADIKIAENIQILDLTAIEAAVTDYFVICSCLSEAQMRAVNNEISASCRMNKMPQPRVEGEESSQWIIMDFFDVVIHLFRPEARDFYQLERLWGDAKFFNISPDGKAVPFKAQSKSTSEKKK